MICSRKSDSKKKAFDNLIKIADEKTYLLYDDIINVIMDYDLPVETMDTFLDNLQNRKIVVSEKPPIRHQNDTIYQIKNSHIKAYGYADGETHFVVLAGSEIKDPPHPGLQNSYYELREKLINTGIIKDANFCADYKFTSASSAATIVLGRNASGNREWITDNGIPFGNRLI